MVYEKKTTVPRMEFLEEYQKFVSSVLKRHGVSVETAIKLRMAIDEIYSNICYYSGAKEFTLGIRVKEEREERTVILYFEDDGIPYNPLDRPNPDVEELLEKRKEGGLGIYLVKKRMDCVIYEHCNDKNRLTVGIRERR